MKRRLRAAFDERRDDDGGATLIELLVTVVIMGTAVIALVAAFATSIRISDIHRKQATAGAAVRSFAEAVENGVAASPSAYTPCATTTTYASLYAAPAGYTDDVVDVTYWNGSAFTATCPAGGDEVQRVTLRVASNDDRASETLAVILRKPCRAGDGPCA